MTELNQTERNGAQASGDQPAGGFAPLVPDLDVSSIDLLRF